MLPIAPSPGPGPILPINRPIFVNGDVIVTPTNEPDNMMETNPAEMDTNGFAATNEVATDTNTFDLASAYALTNRLSVMAPAQAQGVLQVQAGLSSLQDVAGNISGQPSLLDAIQHDPEILRRIHQVGDDILNLTRGQVMPSHDSVDRLCLDFLRASSHVRLPQDHELILAIVINLACNSERLSAADLNDAVNNGVMILRVNAVAPAICNSFGCDLRSIALELQPNPGS